MIDFDRIRLIGLGMKAMRFLDSKGLKHDHSMTLERYCVSIDVQDAQFDVRYYFMPIPSDPDVQKSMQISYEQYGAGLNGGFFSDTFEPVDSIQQASYLVYRSIFNYEKHL